VAPGHVVRKGKTPYLASDEARALLDSIETTRLVGLRDRALIATMIYTFARVSAAIGMKVRDYYVLGRRSRVRLHEKGGKEHEVPCHHNLEQYLDEYIAAAGIAVHPDGPLFRTAPGKIGMPLTRKPMSRIDSLRMIRRRTTAAAIKTLRIGNHSLRATGITAFMANSGTLEGAQTIAAHASTRTDQTLRPELGCEDQRALRFLILRDRIVLAGTNALGSALSLDRKWPMLVDRKEGLILFQAGQNLLNDPHFGVVLGIFGGEYNLGFPPFESGRLDQQTYPLFRCAMTTRSHNSVKIIHPPGGSVNPVSGRRRVK